MAKRAVVRTIVRDRDKGAKKLEAALAKAHNRAITVGVHGEEGAEGEGDSGMTVADVASIHEYGEGDMPQRSWLGSWVDNNAERVQKDFSNLGKAVVKGTISVDDGLEALALKYANSVQAGIRAGIAPPNAESTIKRKGSDKPLVDTGQFVSSITGKTE